MASVFWRKQRNAAARWYAMVDLGERSPEGKVRWKMRSVPDEHQQTEKVALRWAFNHEEEEQEKRTEQGKQAATEWTFDKLADYWLENHSLVACTSHSDNVSRMKVLSAAFGKLRLSEITADRIDEFKAARKSELVDTTDPNASKRALKRREKRRAGRPPRPRSASTVNRYLALLRKVLHDGLRWRRKTGLRENAMEEVTPLPVPEQAFDWLRRAEAEQLLAWTKENAPEVFALYACAIYTGARMGELYGLRWPDVDLEHGKITVRRSYDREYTKSKRIRYPRINKPLAAILREWKLACPKKRIDTDGNEVAVDLVFPRPDARMWSREVPPLGFVAHLAGAKVHKIHFHSLRHTAATLMLEAGVPLRTVQKTLGHSTIQVTEKYLHGGDDEAQADQADRFSLDLARGKVVEMSGQQTS